MRIDELFQKGKPTLSFEFFPPKTEEANNQLFEAIAELGALSPDFVSITRTGGGAPPTLELTARIQNELGITAMSHLTCAGYTREQVAELLDFAWDNGINNILALRGDAAPGQAVFSVTEGGFAHASDLVSFAQERHDFCFGVAGYPEGHPQSFNLTRDAEHIKLKVDKGADFVITQLFYENDDFYRWRDRVTAQGVKVPLIAGVMPITNFALIKKIVVLSGATIPHPLLLKLESLESNPDSIHDAGVEQSARQCQDLLDHGVDGLHFYTLNRSKASLLIAQELGLAGTQAG